MLHNQIEAAVTANIAMSEAIAHSVTAGEIKGGCLQVLLLREFAYRVTAQINNTQRALEAKLDAAGLELAV